MKRASSRVPSPSFTEEQKAEICELCGIKEGDSLFFISDGPAVINKYAGEMRTWLGKELGLTKRDSFEFCFITDFPMYELNPETGKIDFTHNPFSMPQGGMDALVNKDPLEIFAYQYDIVCNGVELSSGAVRNHDPDIMKKAFEIAGYDEDVLKTKFGSLQCFRLRRAASRRHGSRCRQNGNAHRRRGDYSRRYRVPA